jgi:glycyl-tRNA synthetase
MSQDKKPREKSTERMEKIVSLCKRRGFIFQSSEIYGGLNGFWDYGPMGVELKRNLKDFWWRRNVRERDDMVGMDGSIIMNRAVWKASGHEATFSDPMVDCLLTKTRFRADQVPAQSGTVFHFTGAASPTTGWRSEKPFAVLLKKGENVERARKVARQFYTQGVAESLIGEASALELLGESTEEVTDSTSFNPENGSLLTEPRDFNLMFKSHAGPLESEDNLVYLRPETAQAIFVQFKNILETSRQKLPFGIAQIGKAFRNEINPRNYTFRSREFEQMEIEYFCRPEDGLALTDYWLEQRLKFYEDIGLPREKIHVVDIPDGERAFYSKKTYDLEYEFPFGVSELEGVAYRTDYDLSAHIAASGKPLDYFDQEKNEKFVPHVVEPSAGVDRTTLALICEAFAEETIEENGKSETRTVLRFHPRMAPVKVGIFPLLKNKPELVAKARQIVEILRPHMNVFYDETGAIGRRYRRQDEIGTPFCVTVDFDTIGENGPEKEGTVTLRYRDSMEQERIPADELLPRLLAAIH